ncbi:MAG: bifunctional glutamate N-acetyltransferase/amino-acid acetyltransferase ArgJ [Candidatus Omnitrophota bacterium]
MKTCYQAILPIGFLASARSCGIKHSGKPDLGLIYSQYPASAAALITANKVKAACLKLNQLNLSRSKYIKAIIANSGNANCFTGRQGLIDAMDNAKRLSLELGINKNEVLVASTGIIGKRLPVEKINKAIQGLVAGLSRKNIAKVSQAILTTDLVSKQITVQFNLGKKKITICGIAKGSGMIAPNMATMLAFIMTDARVSYLNLKKALKQASDKSFNSITIDGCMSTNDTVIALANGASKADIGNSKANFRQFSKALDIVCLELAKMIVADGEGATKFIEIAVSGARNYQEAKRAALSIANSNLFKTAMYGEDPNFGRVVAGLGASRVSFNEEKLKVKLSPLAKNKIKIQVWLNAGQSRATVYTSDLSPEYIKINAAYN